MLKKSRIVIFLSVVIACVLFISAGSILSVSKENKDKDTKNVVKDFNINADSVYKVGDNLLVRKGQKYGYYDLNGQSIISMKYSFELDNVLDNVDTMDNLFVVSDDGIKYGVIDEKENVIIPKQYIAVKIISSNCFLVEDEELTWSVINKKNKKLITNSYYDVKVIRNYGAILTTNGKTDIIDSNGKIISKSSYPFIVNYYEQFIQAPVVVGCSDTCDIFVFNNKKIKIIEKVSNEYFINDNYIYYSSNGDSYNSYDIKNDKTKNNVEVNPSINGMSLTSNSGLIGYKSVDGKVVIDEKYQKDYSSNFTKYGVAVVGVNGLQGVIDKNGKEILPCLYEKIIVFSDKLFGVLYGGNYYLVDDTGSIVFDNIVLDDNIESMIVVKNSDKCGVVDNYGKMLFDLKYMDCNIYSDLVILKESDNNWFISHL